MLVVNPAHLNLPIGQRIEKVKMVLKRCKSVNAIRQRGVNVRNRKEGDDDEAHGFTFHSHTAFAGGRDRKLWHFESILSDDRTVLIECLRCLRNRRVVLPLETFQEAVERAHSRTFKLAVAHAHNVPPALIGFPGRPVAKRVQDGGFVLID